MGYAPAEVLLGPVPLASIGVLVINDHWAKAHFANTLTGKVSDFAGLVFFPLVIVGLIEVFRRRPFTRRELHAALWVSAIGFAAVKLSPTVAGWYSHLIGVAFWPLRSVASIATGDGPASFTAVWVRADPTDLMALSALGVSWWCAHRCLKQRSAVVCC